MSEEKWYVIGDTKNTRCDVPDYIAKRNDDPISQDYFTLDFVTALKLKIDMLLVEVNRLRTQHEDIKAMIKSGHYIQAMKMIEEL